MWKCKFNEFNSYFFLKKDFASKFELQIKPENIKNLTECSRLLDEILNRKPNKHLPYVGAAAFSHKGGLTRFCCSKRSKNL